MLLSMTANLNKSISQSYSAGYFSGIVQAVEYSKMFYSLKNLTGFGLFLAFRR